jgi:hypothetical protein
MQPDITIWTSALIAVCAALGSAYEAGVSMPGSDDPAQAPAFQAPALLWSHNHFRLAQMRNGWGKIRPARPLPAAWVAFSPAPLKDWFARAGPVLRAPCPSGRTQAHFLPLDGSAEKPTEMSFCQAFRRLFARHPVTRPNEIQSRINAEDNRSTFARAALKPEFPRNGVAAESYFRKAWVHRPIGARWTFPFVH